MSITSVQTSLRKICGLACNFLAAGASFTCCVVISPGKIVAVWGGTAGIAIITRVGCDSTKAIPALKDAETENPINLTKNVTVQSAGLVSMH